MTNQEQYDRLWKNTEDGDTMKKYIDILQDVRHTAYKLGYIEGIEYEKAENEKNVERIKKLLHNQQQRVSWFQEKYARMQENYENQIKNLQAKINHYEELDRRF